MCLAVSRMSDTSLEVLPQNAIRQPSDTIVFGEKDHDSPHFYMDYQDYDDLRQLDQSKHSTASVKDSNGNGGGGSNYALADGNGGFLAFGRAFNPVDLWGVIDAQRNTAISALRIGRQVWTAKFPVCFWPLDCLHVAELADALDSGFHF